MKIKIITILLIASIFISTGCSYVDRSKILEGTVNGKDSQKFYHINAGIGGMYIFSLPLITGNPMGKWPIFFKDNVNVKSLTEMMVDDAFMHNGKVVINNVDSDRSSGLVYFFFQTIFIWRSAQVSANVIVEPESSY